MYFLVWIGLYPKISNISLNDCYSLRDFCILRFVNRECTIRTISDRYIFLNRYHICTKYSIDVPCCSISKGCFWSYTTSRIKKRLTEIWIIIRFIKIFSFFFLLFLMILVIEERFYLKLKNKNIRKRH